MRNKKILTIVIVFIVVLCITGGVLAYLFLATSAFKSDKEMFLEYFSQNIQMLNNMKSSGTYKQILDEETFESNTEIKVSNSRGGEISSPLNDLSMAINMQKDNANRYSYTDAQLLFKDEEYLEVELIEDQDLSGIRFTDVVKQFITKREEDETGKIPVSIEEIISEEEITSIKEKCVNIIKQELENATYSKIKNTMITYNNNTIKTNAYTVTLTQDQVGNIILTILENLKTDEIILQKAEMFGITNLEEEIDKLIDDLSDYENIHEMKITVYEQNDILIRTIVEYAGNTITLENSVENNSQKIKLQVSCPNFDKVVEQNLEITKTTTDNEETYNISIELIDGEDTKTINFTNQLTINEQNIIINTQAQYTQGIETTTITAINNTNLVDNIENKFILDESNNAILTDYDETTRETVINLLKENVPKVFENRINLLSELLGFKQPEEQEPTEPGKMTQVEINRFNAKFEFYTGQSVTAENVKTLLDVVKDNLGNVEITQIGEVTEDMDEEDIKENIKLIIEKDKTNQELIQQVLEKIDDDTKYNVEIVYKQENGIIDYINITEAE